MESIVTDSPLAAAAPATPFSATDAACTRIAKLLQTEPEGSAFFIQVQGGGCSGFQYHFDLKTKPPEATTDHVIQRQGAVIVIDDLSLDMLKNSELDYEETLASAGFIVRNPNATAKCGCGNSFSIG